MISSEKVRPSMKITLEDIFMDYNDPRKEMLAKRVKLVLEDQEKRFAMELQSNNLTNLQQMLRKQQVLKKLQQKIEEFKEQIDELNIKLTYSKTKMQQMQSQLTKTQEINKMSNEKFKQMTTSLKSLEMIVQSKEQVNKNLEKEHVNLKQEKQRVLNQKQRYHQMIVGMRQEYGRKIEVTQYSLKIREKQITEEFHENLDQLKNSTIYQMQNTQIRTQMRGPKIENKNQRIQCMLIGGRQSPRPSARASPRRTQKVQVQIQTQEQEVKALTQIISRNQSRRNLTQNNLEEIRLIYNQRPRMIEVDVYEPKLTRQFAIMKEQKQIQVDPQPILTFSQSIQTQIKVEDDVLMLQIAKLKKSIQTSRQFHEGRYGYLQQKYDKKIQQIENIDLLKLKVGELQLMLNRKNEEVRKERDMLARTNQKLQSRENQLIIHKLIGSGRGESTKKNTFYKTTSGFYPRHQQDSFPLNLNRNRATTYFETPDDIRNSVQMMSPPRKWAEQQQDLITVIKQANHLKSSKVKHRSITEANPSVTVPMGSLLIKRNYTKYSKLNRK